MPNGKLTAALDPALAKIQELADDVATSFQVLEKDIAEGKKELAALGGRVGHVEKFEPDVTDMRARLRGAFKRDTPTGASKISDRAWAEERFLRGYLLAGTPDNSYRELGRSIMEATFPHRSEDWHQKRHQAETAALIPSTDLVPIPVFSEIVAAKSDRGSVRAVSRVVPLSSGTMKVPTLATPFVAALVAEGGSFGDGAGTLDSVDLATKKFGALGTLTLEVVEDSPVLVATEFFAGVRGAATELENQQALEGAGTAEFTGILFAGGPSVALGATPADLDELMEMATTIPEAETDAATCRWFMNKEAARKLLQIHATDSDMPMLGQNAHLTELLGFMVSLVKGLSNGRGTGTNETNIYFGSFGTSMLLGDRGAEHFDTSISATDDIWGKGLVGVRYYRRTAVAVAIPDNFVFGSGMTIPT
jgi:HK97 family phage major capsid protein